jgi:hypothetical protein
MIAVSRREDATRAPPRAPIAALIHRGAPMAVKHEASKTDAPSASSSRGSHAARPRLRALSIVGCMLDTVPLLSSLFSAPAEGEEVLKAS